MQSLTLEIVHICSLIQFSFANYIFIANNIFLNLQIKFILYIQTKTCETK